MFAMRYCLTCAGTAQCTIIILFPCSTRCYSSYHFQDGTCMMCKSLQMYQPVRSFGIVIVSLCDLIDSGLGLALMVEKLVVGRDNIMVSIILT